MGTAGRRWRSPVAPSRYNQSVQPKIMDGLPGMAKSTSKTKATSKKAKSKSKSKTVNKGFGAAQPKKEKGEFSHFWVVDGEVWAFNNQGEGSIKPGKTTNRYKSGDTAAIDDAIKELAGKPDGFYKFGVHKAGSKPSWKFDELSAVAKRSINSTKATLLATQSKDTSGQGRTVFT